jgi:hypothetical protein
LFHTFTTKNTVYPGGIIYTMPACFYLICAGGLSLGHVNLRGLTGGRAEMAARLAAAAAGSSDGSSGGSSSGSSAEWVRSDWIIGTGWSESDWGGGWPDRTWIDEVRVGFDAAEGLSWDLGAGVAWGIFLVVTGGEQLGRGPAVQNMDI